MLLALSFGAFAQIPTNGLIGYWPFNGNAKDQSGNNNNGVCGTVTLTTDRFGNPNSAYYFSNTPSDTIGINNTLPYGDFTFAFWFNLDTIGQDPYFGPQPIDWRNIPNSQNPIMQFIFNPTNKISFVLRDNTHSSATIFISTPTLSLIPRSWYLAVGICKSNVMSLYQSEIYLAPKVKRNYFFIIFGQ